MVHKLLETLLEIFEPYQFDSMKFEFSFVCEYLSFWDVYFRFGIGDGPWESFVQSFGDLFWWRFLNQTCRDIMEYYLLMSLLEIVSWSNHFFYRGQSLNLSRLPYYTDI